METKLIIFDVDGVLTDSTILYDNNFNDLKIFNAKDGFFIKHICALAGIKTAILTGSESKIIAHRAKVLDISYLITGTFEKEAAYLKLKEKTGLKDEEIAYIGDDWFDWPAMKYVGYKGTPADGAAEIKDRVDFISTKKGGNGAAREFIESVLRKDKKFKKVYDVYFG